MNIDERRRLVSTYLRRCVTYSDASITRKKSRGEDPNEIARWQAFREFTAYSASELESGVLDTWLTDEEGEGQPPPSLSDGSESNDTESMSHFDRRNWLASLLMPRPVVLVATKSTSGVENLAPMSSISIVSNSPPLLSMSLSQNREGRPRDTLVNLEAGGIGSPCTLFVLNADIDSAQYVDTTAEPISSDSSEWKLIESEPPILSKALAAIHCTLQEIHQLPAGASGKLAILEVSSFDTPDGMKIDSIPTTLFQTTFDSVGPGPNSQDWRFKLRDY